MTDKKLTDAKIVKALEICGTYKGKCTDCPAFVKVDRSNCKNVLLGAVEIINRLQEENERLQKSYLRNQEIFAEQSLENERLKAEIERLQNILICFMDALGKVRKVDDIDEISLIPLMSELNKQYRAELKAEAYKEFAERLHEELRIYGIKDKFNKSVFLNVVDKAKKELVGEGDA